MKLVKVILENFRSYKDKTIVEIDNFTIFIGRNDAGKSSILEALDIFFENSKMDQGDACIFGNPSSVRIGCVFSEFPKELIIDSTNLTTLFDEYLLNEDGLLELHKIYDCTKSNPKAERIVAIANHPTEEKSKNLLTLNNAKLKALAKEIGADLKTIDQTKNADLRFAIRSQVKDLLLQESEISLMKDTGKAVFESLSTYMPVYALFKSDRASTDQDSEAQDPMKSAIKEAIKAQEAQLIKMTEEINKKVQEIADLTVERIRDFSVDLASALNPTVKNKNWDSLFSVSLTDEDEIPINKRGSGVRRLILLSFFRAKAELSVLNANSNGLIYAIEEPETSQHPHNQKILIETLRELSEIHGNQIIITTHTPVLVKNISKSHLRYIKQDGIQPTVLSCSDENAREIAINLGVIPDHNVKCFLGVEGKHDISFLSEISQTLNRHDNTIPNLKSAESEGHLVFIPLGGSSLELWVSRINGLERPQFYLMDRDVEPPQEAKYQRFFDQFVEEGHTAWITSKLELENYVHPDVIKARYPNYSGTGVSFEDVPHLLAKAIHEENALDNVTPWAEVCLDKEKLKKKESNAKKRINEELVKQMTKANLDILDPDEELINWLREIGRILRAQ